jgi:hypothetical protein
MTKRDCPKGLCGAWQVAQNSAVALGSDVPHHLQLISDTKADLRRQLKKMHRALFATFAIMSIDGSIGNI